MIEDRIKPVTVAALATVRLLAGGIALETIRSLWWDRARPAVVPWLEQPAFPVAHAALAAALLFSWWIQSPLELGRFGDGWRYLTVTWQRPADDEPIWSFAAGPMTWVTEGRIEARWGNARWSTDSLTGAVTAAA